MPSKVRTSFARWVNTPHVVAALLALVALGCVGGALLAYSDATALRDHGIRTVAEVVDVHDGRRGYVVVRFRDTLGAEVSAEVGNYLWDPKPRVGDHPELIFDPDNPAWNVADVRMGPDFFSVWAFAVSAVLAAALVFPTWTGRLDWSDR